MVVAVLSACGSSDKAGTGETPSLNGYDGPTLPQTPGPLPLEELGDAYERILCEALVRCQQTDYRDAEECQIDREPEGLLDIVAGVDDGRFRYDPEAMGECRRFFEQNLCSAAGSFLFVPSVQDIVSLCMLGFGGTGEEGAPCRGHLECSRDFFCDDTTSCPGICRARVGLGEACTSNTECAPIGPIPELTLAELAQGGEELARDIEAVSTDCFDGICRATSKPGDPCIEPATPTVGFGGCVGSTTFCDEATNQCTARREAGEACAGDDQCIETQFCDGPGDPPTGTCRPESAEGGPCFETSHCAGDLRCLEKDGSGRGRCGPPTAEGACEVSNDCAEGRGCIEGRCEALPGAGSPCPNSECAPGAACIGAVCSTVSHPGDACNDVDLPCLGVCRGGTCDARSALGSTCAVDDECASRSCPAGSCVDDELCENR